MDWVFMESPTGEVKEVPVIPGLEPAKPGNEPKLPAPAQNQ